MAGLTTVVFLGPTLGVVEASALLPAVYLPPAARGDVYAASRTRPRAIAIVDGFFHGVPSVLHKEVLWAMAQGIHVYGAASMGALRAAELERFGMVGVGRVFEAYRDGTLTDDDEVAVVHGPATAGYVSGSEAMVNIRATLARARDAAVIDAGVETILLGLAKGTFYPRRSWDRILDDAREAAGVPEETRRRLSAWLPAGRVDQKRDDAIELLRRIGAAQQAAEAPKQVAWRFHSTSMWEELAESMEQRPEPVPGAELVLEGEVLDELRLTGAGFLREWLRHRGSVDHLRARAWNKQDLLSRAGLTTPSLADAGMTEPELWQWYFGTRLGAAVPADLDVYAAQYDFAGVDLMRRAVLREFLYLRKTT